MRALFLAALLVAAPLASLALPAASAGCLSRSTDAAGHNVTFRVGFPTKPDYICAPYLSLDGDVILP